MLAFISSLTPEAQAFNNNDSAGKTARYEVRTATLAPADTIKDPVEPALRMTFESAPPIITLRIAFEAGFLNHFGEGKISRNLRLLFYDRHLPSMVGQAGVLLDQRGDRRNRTPVRQRSGPVRDRDECDYLWCHSNRVVLRRQNGACLEGHPRH